MQHTIVTRPGGVVLGVVGPVDRDGTSDMNLGEEGGLLAGGGAPRIGGAGGRHLPAAAAVIDVCGIDIGIVVGIGGGIGACVGCRRR